MSSPGAQDPLPDYVLEALDAPLDLSPEFNVRIGEIRTALAAALLRTVDHDPDMNYRTGQVLRVWASEDGGDDPGQPRYELAVLLSAKQPLYAFVLFANQGVDRRGPWVSVARPWPSSLDSLTAGVRELLDDHQWREVPGEVLDRQAPARTTVMDGAPASVQEALFAEVI